MEKGGCVMAIGGQMPPTRNTDILVL